MSRYPPLSDDELRQLYQRNPSDESRRLLWEIARLQDFVADLGDFLAVMDGAALRPGQRLAHEILLERFHGEPYAQRVRVARNQKSNNDTRPTVYGGSMVEAFVGPPERWQVEARRMGESRSKRRR